MCAVVEMVSPVRVKVVDAQGVVSIVHVSRLRKTMTKFYPTPSERAGMELKADAFTWEEICNLSLMDARVRTVPSSRNPGEEVVIEDVKITESNGAEYLVRKGATEPVWMPRERVREGHAEELRSFEKSMRDRRRGAR